MPQARAKASPPVSALPMPAPSVRAFSRCPQRPRRMKRPFAISPAGRRAATAPLSILDGADGLWLDVSGVPHLFGGESALLADLAGGLRAQGSPRGLLLPRPWGARMRCPVSRPDPPHRSLMARSGARLRPSRSRLCALSRDHPPLAAARAEAHRPALRSAAGESRTAVPCQGHGRGRSASSRSGARGAAKSRASRFCLCPISRRGFRCPSRLITHDGVLAGLDRLAHCCAGSSPAPSKAAGALRFGSPAPTAPRR